MSKKNTIEFLLARTAARKAAGLIPAKGTPAAKSGPALLCKSRLPATGETETCPTCRGGKVTLKVYGCEVYGTCTIGRRVDGRGCCTGACPGYSA